MTFMNFPEDTVEQKAETVGRIVPHTEVSRTPEPPDPISRREPHPSPQQGLPGPGLGLSLRADREEELSGRPEQ